MSNFKRAQEPNEYERSSRSGCFFHFLRQEGRRIADNLGTGTLAVILCRPRRRLRTIRPAFPQAEEFAAHDAAPVPFLERPRPFLHKGIIGLTFVHPGLPVAGRMKPATIVQALKAPHTSRIRPKPPPNPAPSVFRSSSLTAPPCSRTSAKASRTAWQQL